MSNINKLYLFILLLVSVQLQAQDSKLLQLKNSAYLLNKAKRICDNDAGSLWGENLYSALLVIDVDTRFIVSNDSIALPNTEKINGLFVNYFPNDKVIASGVTELGGKTYTMLSYNKDGYDTNVLVQTIIHEMFHHFQNKKGWDTICASYYNPQMDTKWGRVYLKLELNALKKALLSSKADRKRAIEEALSFRKARQVLFADNAMDESCFELQEGLAQYTQLRLCLEKDTFKIRLIADIDEFINKKTFVRNFGYITGGVYSFLNDDSVGWNKDIYQIKDITTLTKKIYGLDSLLLPIDTDLLNKYNYDDILKYEDSIALQRKKFKENIEKKLEKDFVLELSFNEIESFGINANEVYEIQGLGAYYGVIEVVGAFGRIKTQDGCLINGDRVTLFFRDNIKLKDNKFISERVQVYLNDNYTLNKKKKYYLSKIN